MLVLCLIVGTLCVTNAANTTGGHHPSGQDPIHLIKALEQRVNHIENNEKQLIKDMARQMMLQQLFVEERIRSDGDSGLKQTRVQGGGTRPYHTNTYASGGVAAIHEHANYDRTVGMGEFIAVLNGVEFRTRHNDYKLRMPAQHSKDYNKMEDIPFPPVPPSVLKKANVQQQIAEMKEYFKAFHDQNTHNRDWRPYFKPVLCYLEGGWTTDTKTLQEPFQSDRHGLEASSWFDLQEKIRYTSNTGGKNNNENFSFLPTAIVNVTEDGVPIFAQWNYRIACHPIQQSFDLRYLTLVDDLASRLRVRKNFTEFAKSRAARFTIPPWAGRYVKEMESSSFNPRRYNYGMLDKIMFEIPGKDNYNSYNTDNSFDLLKHRVDTKNATVLNTAKYHRWYKVMQRGAMGLSTRKRGYSDDNMWTAKTSNPRIVKSSIHDCYKDKKTHKKVCKTYEGRYTYAIPLELVWMTPLSSWNPYNFTIINDYRKAHIVTDGGRNGDQHDKKKAFNGVSYRSYYLTPAEFFEGGEVSRDAADTAKNSVGVLDQHGQIRRVSATGHRVFLPEIHGVGKIRQRYPIMPVHQDGSVIMKNLDALQDIMMDMKTNTFMFEKRPEIKDLDAHQKDTHYVTTTTHATPPGMHYHDLYVTAEQMNALHRNGTHIMVYTTENNGHQHELELALNPTNKNVLKVVKCDHQTHCWDKHGVNVYLRHD